MSKTIAQMAVFLYLFFNNLLNQAFNLPDLPALSKGA
jgi:hypothetical protein